MKRTLVIGLSLLTIVGLIPTSEAAPVQYVKVCPIYGDGWNYIPGTAQCINQLTGVIKTQTDNGTTINSTSDLAKRVAQLEAQLQRVYQQFGIQPLEEKQ